MNRRKKPYFVIATLLGAICILNSCTSEHSVRNADLTSEVTTVKVEQAPSEISEVLLPDFNLEHMTLTQLQEDFDQIKRTMISRHPKLYTDVAELEALLASQYLLLEEGMTALDFYRVVAPIISASWCGHTSIGLSDEDFATVMASSRLLPFSLYWQNNVALVNVNTLIPKLPIGAQVLSINGVGIDEVMAGLMENISSDGENQTQKVRAINDGFRYYYAMDCPTPSELNIEFIDPEQGVKREMVVQTVTKVELEAAGDSIWGIMNWLSWENSSSFEENYARLRMASFYPSGSESVDSYNDFIDDFFEQVKVNQVDTIVLDLRDNFGGDPNVAAHLFSYLEKSEVPYFEAESGAFYPQLVEPVTFAKNRFTGKLYVLINGNCFSTTGHFLALLKYYDIGMMIGEESGGSFACSDASSTVSLDHTRLRFRTSSRIFQVAVEGLTPGRGIFPDYPVVATLEEIQAKKDIEMAKVLELIRKP